MTTIWDLQPEAVAALKEGSLWSGLSADARAALVRIYDRTTALVTPLTRVESLEGAETLAASAEAEYQSLIEQWRQTLRASGITPAQFAAEQRKKSLLSQYFIIFSKYDRERWQGVLTSEAGYVAWIDRSLAVEPADDEGEEFNRLAEATTGPFSRYLLAKHAVVTLFAMTPTPLPQTLSVLTELADRCMTEVEDAFLAQAERDDDEGGVVPLAEVRADLGL